MILRNPRLALALLLKKPAGRGIGGTRGNARKASDKSESSSEPPTPQFPGGIKGMLMGFGVRNIGIPTEEANKGTIEEAAERYGIDPAVLSAIIAWESSTLQRLSLKSAVKAVGKSSWGWLGALISPIGEGISRLVTGKGLIENVGNLLPGEFESISFEGLYQRAFPGGRFSKSFGIAQINLDTANRILREAQRPENAIPLSFDPTPLLNLSENQRNWALANLLHSSPEFSMEMAAANLALNKIDIETNAAGYQQGLSGSQMNYLLITSYNYSDIVSWVGQTSSFADLNVRIQNSEAAMNYWNRAGYVYTNMH
jgi:hypothetical protein